MSAAFDSKKHDRNKHGLFEPARHDRCLAKALRKLRSRRWLLALIGWLVTAAAAGSLLAIGVVRESWEELLVGCVAWCAGAFWFWLFLGADPRHFRLWR